MDKIKKLLLSLLVMVPLLGYSQSSNTYDILKVNNGTRFIQNGKLVFTNEIAFSNGIAINFNGGPLTNAAYMQSATGVFTTVNGTNANFKTFNLDGTPLNTNLLTISNDTTAGTNYLQAEVGPGFTNLSWKTVKFQPITNDAPTGYAYLRAEVGGNVTNLSWVILPELKSNVSYTVSNSMTTAQIQSVIDSIPKIMNGKSATLTFTSGTYTQSTDIVFEGFTGGSLLIIGNNDGAGNYTNQTSIINSGAGCTYTMIIRYNSSYVYIGDLAFSVDTSIQRFGMVTFGYPGFVQVSECFFNGTSTAAGYAVDVYEGAKMRMDNCVFNNWLYAVNAESGGLAVTYSGTTAGTPPAYGHVATGGIILRMDTNDIGSTDNNISYGGLIVKSTGAAIP